MADSWNDMKRAKEEQFFAEENNKALERLKAARSGKKRLSPVTGNPMNEVTMMGVNVDVCPESGGIWLDKGELELLLQAAKKDKDGGFIEGLLGGLWKK